MKWHYLSFMGLLMLAGCATMPQELSVAQGTPLAAYSLARQGQEVGKTARWGGVVAKVSNLKTRTQVEIVYAPLDSNGKPSLNDPSPGRFYAYIPGFVDPMSMPTGYYITVIGTVQPAELGKVGDFTYHYPVVSVSNFKLWAPRQQTDVYISHPYWPYWGYPYGYWGDPFFYSPIYYPSYRVKVKTHVVPKPVNPPRQEPPRKEQPKTRPTPVKPVPKPLPPRRQDEPQNRRHQLR